MTPTLAPSAPALTMPHYGTGPWAAVKRYFLKYASFTGRASRSEYWWVALFHALFFVAFFALVVGVAAAASESSGSFGPVALGFSAVMVIYGVGTFVPSLALNSRRLHDAGFSGWLQLVAFIPMVGSLILLVLMLIPSSPEGERYDPFDAHTSAMRSSAGPHADPILFNGRANDEFRSS